MAGNDRRIDLTIGAEDEASEVLDEVADKLGELEDGEALVEVEADADRAIDDLDEVADQVGDLDGEGAEIEVEADTREAISRIEKLDREIEDATGDTKELRIEFAAQKINREIRTLLSELEKAEDPVRIEALTEDLERAQGDLRELADLADKKYSVEVDADPKRNAQRAAGDLDSMRERGEGLQSALPAMRGFTDELGGSAQKAGVASQAIADLGDFSLIMGERFGVSQEATARLGTALGAIGLGGVVIGGVIAGFEYLQRGAKQVRERIAELTDGILDQIGVAEEIEQRFDSAGTAYEAFADRLLSDEDDRRKVNESLADLGLTIEDLPQLLADIDSGGIEDLIDAGLGGDEAAEALERMRAAGVKFEDLDTSASMLLLDDATRDTLSTFEDLVSITGNLQIDQTASAVLDEISVSSVAARSDIEGIRDALGEGATDVDVLDAYLRSLADAEEAAERAEKASDDLEQSEREQADAAAAAAEAEAERAAELAEAERKAEEARRATEELAQAEIDGAEAALSAADSRRAAADSAFAFTKAQNDLDDAVVAALETVADGESTWNDLEESLINVAEGSGNVADAAVRQAQDQAAATGETLSQSDATGIWNKSMIGSVSTLNGPMRKAVLDYIAEVNGIPPEKVSEIEALIDQGKLAEAEAALNGASEKRDAEIEAEAKKSQAESDLNNAARDRTANIYANLRARSGYVFLPGGGRIPLRLAPGEGNPIPTNPVPTPLTRTNGEDLFDPTGSSSSSRSSATGGTTNVTVNLPRAAEARDVARELRKWARVNGR